MATNKAASQKKATAKKPATAAKNKTTVRTLSAKDDRAKKPVVTKPVMADPVVHERRSSKLPGNIVNIVLAELFGTFILSLVALLALRETGLLYVGLAYAAITLAVGAVSGAHVNPAVTFGMWSMRRLKGVLVPFYIGAQLFGALLAVAVLGIITGGSPKIELFGAYFNHFLSFNWSIFGIELVGTLVFLFILAAVQSRDLSKTGRALGTGLALLVGLGTATALYSRVYAADVAKYQETAAASASAGQEQDLPRSVYVGGTLLNPAIAVAATEKTKGEVLNGAAGKDDKQYSRFTLEVIFGTLIGAALGGNLYLLVAGRQRD